MRAPCHRLFYALRPPPGATLRGGRIRDELEGHGQVSNARLHLTIGVTEDFETFPEGLERAMASFAAEVSLDPFCLTLDRLAASQRSIALRPSSCPPQLRALQRQLGGPLSRWRIQRADWRFSPHMTLLYREGQPFLRPIAPIAWQVTDFVLIHSVVGEATHIELGRWPLIGRQGRFDF